MPVLKSLPWLVPSVVILLTGVTFIGVLHNGFVNWADDKSILENPHYRGLGWTHLQWMFATFYLGSYQPLTWLSLAIDYLIWGVNPGGYHFTHLLLHIVNALLFYFLTLRLLSIGLAGAKFRETPKLRMAAGFAALLFSLHPLRVVTVAWAAQRGDVLAAAFFLATLLYYLRAVENPLNGADRRRSMRLALIFYALSLLSRPHGIILPLALIILDAYPLRRLPGDWRRWFEPAWRSLWWEKAPFVALALGAGILAAIARYPGEATGGSEELGFLERIAQIPPALVFFLFKTIFPVGISPLYEVPSELNPWNWLFLSSALAVLIVSAGLFVLRRRWPAVLASWLYYVGVLASTLGISPSGSQFAAGRYTYLADFGWAMLAGLGVYMLWQHWGVDRIDRRTIYGGGIPILAVLLTLGLLTWKQIQVWHDAEALWRHTVSIRSESVVARTNLGRALSDSEKLDEALGQLRKALEIAPNDQDARYFFGNTLARQGKLEGAINEFRLVLKINPGNIQARYDLGTALAAHGEPDEAMAQFQRVIATEPSSAKAHYNLGAILARKGQFQEAIAHFQKAVSIDPSYGRAHYALAFVQARRGEVPDAIEHYRQTLKSTRGDFEIHFNYAIALAKHGNLVEAETQFREALRIKPDFAQAYHSLGLILVTQGKTEQAIESFTRAVHVDPRFAESHQSLGEIFASLGKKNEAAQHYQAALRILRERSGSSTPHGKK